VRDGPPYRLFADIVLSLHVAVVLFVVGGLALIIVGNLKGRRWVNAPWFRVTHLGAIAVVVAEAWLRLTCPLTTLESWLRSKAGEETYSAGFIEQWLGRMLYYEAPAWVFVLGYSVFGLLVLAAWRSFPPTSRHRG
jgi:hypothetical protein